MEIRLYEKNAKKHPKDQLKGIAKSIERFGCKQPIVIDREGVIVVGHGRYLAMRDVLGWKEIKESGYSKKGDTFIPYIFADDLSEAEIKVYRLVDNKWNESGWKLNLVGEELLELDSDLVEITGFRLGEKEDSEDVEGDEDFTSEVLEENNYVLFVFDSVVDWQFIVEKLGIKSVKALDSKEGYERKGTGRVLDGRELVKILNEKE